MSKKREQERGSIPNHGRPCCHPPVPRIVTQSRACHTHDRGLLERPIAGTLTRPPLYLTSFPCTHQRTLVTRSASPPQAPFPSLFLISMADSTLFRVGCQVGCFRDPPASPIPSPFPPSRHPPIPSSIHPTRESWGVVGGQYGGGDNYPIFQKIFPLYDVLYVTWACVGGVGVGTPGPSRDRMKPDFS